MFESDAHISSVRGGWKMEGQQPSGAAAPEAAQRSCVCGPVLCLVGPTATGKSDLGKEIAQLVGGEVLSADSMQVYKGMNIGTAKLTPAEMEGVPHHLINLVEPDVRFTVADWTRAADRVIADIHHAGRLPIVVGGTGLYIRSIVEDLDFAEQPGTAVVRAKWQAFMEAQGVNRLHDELRRRDAVQANRLHPNDVRRVIRALEVFELGQRTMSEQYDWRVKGGRYETVQFGLTMERPALYEQIDRRVVRMMAAGLYDEVAQLLGCGYDERFTSMQAIGYKEMLRAVRGEISANEATMEIARATRRFAKRQLSWFRRDPRVQWLTVDSGQACWLQQKAQILQIATTLAAGILPGHRE